MEYKRKYDYLIENNKLIEFKKIDGIYIKNFRLFNSETVNLGDNITVFSGRNGSMKSTILGLISHIYRTNNRDVFNKKMQTELKEVFRLSLDNDKEKYTYNLRFTDTKNNKISEPVEIYMDNRGARHRIVPSGHESGDGYFSLCSIYLNLKRLYPLVDIPNINSDTIREYTSEEDKFVSEFYEQILLREEFSDHEHFIAKKGTISKAPISPKNSYYGVDALSSGEDNLSQFVSVLISFMRIQKQINPNNDKLTGILSIDEFDSSLHPIAQLNLYKFLLKWSKKYNVQILISTHSLFLLKEILFMKRELESSEVIVNFITPGYKKKNQLSILKNPSYDVAVKELTLKESQPDEIIKVNILVEDEIASHALSRILRERKIHDRLNIIHKYNKEKDGTSWVTLKTFANNFSNILYESRSMIVLDQDVSIKEIKSFDNVLKLPSLSEHEVPFEQELTMYLMKLDAGDEFFQRNSVSKEMIKQEFKECRLPLSYDNLIPVSNIKNIKKWFNENKPRNKSFITQMINDPENQEIYSEFKTKFLIMTNDILNSNGLPIISGQK